MTEATFARYLSKMFKQRPILWQRNESGTTARGIPDVFYSLPSGPDGWQQGGWNIGWVELKHVKDWPRRPKTTLTLRNFSLPQQAFMRTWGGKTGRCWVFVKVGRERHADYLLFGWKQAVTIPLGKTKAEMFESAHAHWHGKVDVHELEAALMGRCR